MSATTDLPDIALVLTEDGEDEETVTCGVSVDARGAHETDAPEHHRHLLPYGHATKTTRDSAKARARARIGAQVKWDERRCAT